MEFMRFALSGFRDNPSETRVMFRTVGHDKEFVPGMEIDEACCGRLKHELLPAGFDEYPFDEVFPQLRVMQPSIVLDRYQREPPYARAAEDAHAAPVDRPRGPVDLDPVEP